MIRYLKDNEKGKSEPLYREAFPEDKDAFAPISLQTFPMFFSVLSGISSCHPHLRFLCLKSRTVWTCCLDSSLHPPGLPLCCLAAVALPGSGQ